MQKKDQQEQNCVIKESKLSKGSEKMISKIDRFNGNEKASVALY